MQGQETLDLVVGAILPQQKFYFSRLILTFFVIHFLAQLLLGVNNCYMLISNVLTLICFKSVFLLSFNVLKT